MISKNLRSLLYLNPFLLTLALGSCADYNSNTFDGSVYQAPPGDSSDLNFASAYAILSTNCAGCHAWVTSLTTSSAWVSAPGERSVVPGSPDTSPLVQRLKNFTPPGNMPPGPPISNNDYLTIRAWIQNIP
jgi:hypothetical protein